MQENKTNTGNARLRICVVIPARNSREYIGRCISSIHKQILRPRTIIVIDDASDDDTAEIAERLGAYVIRIERKHVYATGTPLLAFLINQGMQVCIENDHDFIFISGSDDIYPINYLRDLVKNMVRDKVVIASGRVVGEPYDIEIPRGGGRVILSSFIKHTGLLKHVYGWEVEIVMRAWSHGLKTKTYPHLLFYSLRKSSRNPDKFYFLGKAMKELNYPVLYTLLRSLYTGFKLGSKYMYNMIYGYFNHNKRGVTLKESLVFRKKLLIKLISLSQGLKSRVL